MDTKQRKAEKERQIQELIDKKILTKTMTKGENFDAAWPQIVEGIKRDPIKNFVESPLFCNILLSPVQTVITKLILNVKLNKKKKYDIWQRSHNAVIRDKYENKPVIHLIEDTLNEYEIFHLITGKYYTDFLKINKNSNISDIDFICGRRGGKSMIAIILKLYKAVTKNWTEQSGESGEAKLLFIAHTKDFAADLLKRARTRINQSPILNLFIDENETDTSSVFFLKVPWIEGTHVEYSKIKLATTAANDQAGIGGSTLAATVDEIATYNSDPTLKVTDDKVLEALIPSMSQYAPDNQLFKPTSAREKGGVSYNAYLKWSRSKYPLEGQLVIVAPSWMMNPERNSLDFLRSEQSKRGNDYFYREYGAEFCDKISGFFKVELVERMVGNNNAHRNRHQKGYMYSAAIDAADVNDYFTLSVVGFKENYNTLSLEKQEETKEARQFVATGVRGKDTPEGILDSKKIAKEYCLIIKSFGITKCYCDQYNFGALAPIFKENGVLLEKKPFNQRFKLDIYNTLRQYAAGDNIELLDHKIQTLELKSLEERVNGNSVSIGHPSAGGIGDDFTDALALAVAMGHGSKDSIAISIQKDRSSFNMGDPIGDPNTICRATGKSTVAPMPGIYSHASTKADPHQGKAEAESYGVVDNSGGKILEKATYIPLYGYILSEREDLEDFRASHPISFNLWNLNIERDMNKIMNSMIQEDDGKIEPWVKQNYKDVNYDQIKVDPLFDGDDE